MSNKLQYDLCMFPQIKGGFSLQTNEAYCTGVVDEAYD